MFDKFIQKIGMDKVANFGIGAAIAFIISNITMLQDGFIGWHNILYPIIGVVVVAVLEFFKEYIIDYKLDKKDFIATILGSLLPFISNLIGILFYIGSH